MFDKVCLFGWFEVLLYGNDDDIDFVWRYLFFGNVNMEFLVYKQVMVLGG